MAEDLNIERFIVLKEEYETLRGSMNKSGATYDKISNIERDLVTCAHYLARQADNVDAIYWICDKYLYGGCETGISTEQFEEYLKTAIEKEHVPSMCLLARYYHGWGRPMSARQVRKADAIDLFERAAKVGNQDGRYNLACALRESGDSTNRKKSEKLLTDLMNEGYLGAFYTYYLRFFWEEEGPHHGNEQGGFEVLLRALSCIDTRGLSQEEFYASEIYYYIALCYYEGVGCDQNVDRAVNYMRKSATLREYGDAYFWLKNKGLSVEPRDFSDHGDISYSADEYYKELGDNVFEQDEEEPYEDDLTSYNDDCPEDLKTELKAPLGFLPFKKKEEDQSPITREDLDRVLKPFDKLIGLDGIKEQIRMMFYTVMANELRRSKGVHLTTKQSLHMVFTGNPGTGKTMVARLLGDVFKELRILKKGHVVEVDRSTLIGQYIGQTETITKEVVNKAIGGVLFIDEAHGLEKGYSPNDFGQDALSLLVKEMEDFRNNMVVIMAGYPQEMNWMLDSNPGLRSRIGVVIDFPDYTDDEMTNIFETYVEEIGFKINKAAKEKVAHVICGLEGKKKDTFGNARGVRKMFEESLRNQARRIIEGDITHKTQLITIREEDIPGKIIPKGDGKIVRLK